MSDDGFDSPLEWEKRSSEDQRAAALVEYQYEIADETTYFISVFRPTVGTEGYILRLSTINLTSTHARHDYPIETYDSREAALAGAESFIEHFSRRLQEGYISSTNPDIERIREVIDEFTDDRRCNT